MSVIFETMQLDSDPAQTDLSLPAASVEYRKETWMLTLRFLYEFACLCSWLKQVGTSLLLPKRHWHKLHAIIGKWYWRTYTFAL